MNEKARATARDIASFKKDREEILFKRDRTRAGSRERERERVREGEKRRGRERERVRDHIFWNAS